MKAEGGSRTAVLTCQGRAVADGRGGVASFSDPVAYALLRADERAVVDAARSGTAPRSIADRMGYEAARASAAVMVPRTVAIDEAVRARPGGPAEQLVLLGAGLDSRPYRMVELAATDVFEVDHPASQRDKRDRLGGWDRPALARSVRFVPVDLARDPLGEALPAAGFRPDVPVTWVWEGVVPYLTPAEVNITVAAVASLSAPGSRLVTMYLAPAAKAVAWMAVARLLSRIAGQRSVWADEPHRSAWTPEAFSRLLTQHGFTVSSDESLADITRHLGLTNIRRAASTNARVNVAER